MLFNNIMKYSTFNKKLANSTILTGVRNAEKNKYGKSKKVFLTGFYKINGIQTGFIYKGNGIDSDDGIFYPIKFPGSYLTSPYGPDRTGKDTVSIVGNYNLTSGSYATGFLYNGPYKNTNLGTWISIVPPFKNAVNCIMHSVMNGVAVGNYGNSIMPQVGMGLQSDIYSLLFNSHTNQYYNITYPGVSSISTYGIFHNEDSHYTIAGGYLKNKKNRAFIADWDSVTGQFSNWKSYKYNNSDSSLITHFDGITGLGNNVYNLTGNYVNEGGSQAFFCTVNRNTNSSKWTTVYYPDSEITSGNTVINDTTYGVYVKNQKVSGFSFTLSNGKNSV
jgi:hypothetical protein